MKMMMMMMILFRLRRLSMGMVAHCSYHGNYRFCYISRGTPGGATHSVLLLHGFTANKDSWLPIVKVPAPVQWWWVCKQHEHSAISLRVEAFFKRHSNLLGLFISLLQYFPKDWHVVCLDMPGHAGTSRTRAEDYSIQGQVKRIHQVCSL